MSRLRKLRKQENQKGYPIYSLSVPAEVGDKFDVDNDKFYCSLSKEGHIVFSKEEVYRYQAEPLQPEETQQPEHPEQPPAVAEAATEEDIWDFASEEETPESVFERKEDKPDNSMFEGW